MNITYKILTEHFGENYTAMQSQMTVYPYLYSKQILRDSVGVMIQGSPIKVRGPTQHMAETVDHIY